MDKSSNIYRGSTIIVGPDDAVFIENNNFHLLLYLKMILKCYKYFCFCEYSNVYIFVSVEEIRQTTKIKKSATEY